MTTGTDYRVSIDIGGTFTDFVFQDTATGRTTEGKALSTPGNLALAVIDGLRRFQPAGTRASFLVHGTTAGLNALLEGAVPVCCWSPPRASGTFTPSPGTTAGRFQCPLPQAEPLVPPDRVVEVRERLAADGSVLVPIEQRSLARRTKWPARRCRRRRDAVLLNLKPVHELVIEQHLAEAGPGHLLDALVPCVAGNGGSTPGPRRRS